MRRGVRIRFWVEAGAAGLTALLLVVTLVSREWIEAAFGIDPDGGSGAVEWAVVAALLATSAASSMIARAEWRNPLRPRGFPSAGS